MKPLLLSGLALLLLCAAYLTDESKSARTLETMRQEAASALSEQQVGWTTTTARSWTARVFRTMPSEIREKVIAKAWPGVELVFFRALLFRHMLPVFCLSFLVGLLEGACARRNHQAVVRIHSPLWFRASLLSLAFLPVGAALWIAAPVAVPPSLVCFLVFSGSIWACRNLVIQVPSHF